MRNSAMHSNINRRDALAILTLGGAELWFQARPFVASDAPDPRNDNYAPLSQRKLITMIREIAVQNGINAGDFEKMARIESQLNPFAYNRHSGAAGLFQFTEGTAHEYKLGDPYDAKANAEAAARLWNHNRKYLQKVLERMPTSGMIYLAHQQGASGAFRLLTNPHSKATDIVGLRAVILNGGTPEDTAEEFARRWTSRFD
jgi:Transglycosylase SLT domain